MNFDIMTIFPEMLRPYFDESIIGRAKNAGYISIGLHNIRDYSTDKHRRTDDTPYGGGYGMVMTPQPIIDCHKEIVKDKTNVHTIYMSPSGKKLTQSKAKKLLKYDNIVILCGHYEGVDQRVLDLIVDEEMSVGDYVLTGGELPAAILVDCVSRLIPGVLPDALCHEDESIESGLLEYPQYTRPREFMGLSVPDVLLNGNHAHILKWREEKSIEKTFNVRRDLLRRKKLSKDMQEYVCKLKENKEKE